MWKQMTASTPVSSTYYQLIFCCEILKSNNGVASRMRPISDLKHSTYVLSPLYEFSSKRNFYFKKVVKKPSPSSWLSRLSHQQIIPRKTWNKTENVFFFLFLFFFFSNNYICEITRTFLYKAKVYATIIIMLIK